MAFLAAMLGGEVLNMGGSLIGAKVNYDYNSMLLNQQLANAEKFQQFNANLMQQQGLPYLANGGQGYNPQISNMYNAGTSNGFNNIIPLMAGASAGIFGGRGSNFFGSQTRSSSTQTGQSTSNSFSQTGQFTSNSFAQTYASAYEQPYTGADTDFYISPPPLTGTAVNTMADAATDAGAMMAA